ncbi:hypothetical protein P8452_09645 [Trifolium repens]|nr:hypothetical protein P8452_09645 [Trifolium repens]
MIVKRPKSHSSTLDIHSTVTVPLKRPERVKAKPSQKKNKKVAKERDLFKKNYVHACDSLLFLMANKRHHRETAILSLKKSGPELSNNKRHHSYFDWSICLNNGSNFPIRIINHKM